MKLAKLQIENFRHLGPREKPFVLDLTDELGRVRDFTLLVGPNTSGKTTILDAIAAALEPAIGLPALRPGFRFEPRLIVRPGELRAKVTCWLQFTSEEIAATQEIRSLANKRHPPEAREVKVIWTYPGQTENGGVIRGNQPLAGRGSLSYEPHLSDLLLTARDNAARLIATGRADWSWFRKVGGLFTFDQDRTGQAKTISRQIWNIIHGTAEAAKENPELRTTDPRTILIELALQALVPRINGKIADEFRLIQERYASICTPRKIIGPFRNELGDFDIQFHDGENDYTYDGLSSGEKNVLLLLIRFVAERIHQSIVLIDELELNQHPIWQARLVHWVQRMGDGNQIIATTHSDYLRGVVSPRAVIELGELGEVREAGAR